VLVAVFERFVLEQARSVTYCFGAPSPWLNVRKMGTDMKRLTLNRKSEWPETAIHLVLGIATVLALCNFFAGIGRVSSNSGHIARALFHPPDACASQPADRLAVGATTNLEPVEPLISPVVRTNQVWGPVQELGGAAKGKS
jgi:predicted small secreted protein